MRKALIIKSLRRLAVFAAVLAISLAEAEAQVAASRIGFVFTERLMTESKMAKAADAKIEAEFSKRQATLAEGVRKFKVMSGQFDNETQRLTDSERTRRARELFDMEKDVQRMQREFREDLMHRKGEARAVIAQKAYMLIEQIAEQEKLDVVLPEAAWSSPRIDITDKVLKLLDQ